MLRGQQSVRRCSAFTESTRGWRELLCIIQGREGQGSSEVCCSPGARADGTGAELSLPVGLCSSRFNSCTVLGPVPCHSQRGS